MRETPAKCKSVVRNNRLLDTAHKKVDRMASAFDQCVDKSCMLHLRKHMGECITDSNVKAMARCAVTRCPKAASRLEAAHDNAQTLRKKNASR